MQFRDLRIEDFLSVGVAEIPLANQGLVLIEGDNRDDPSAESNGAGKSSVFEALLWCLYGVTLRGLEGDEVVRRGKKKCCVEVVFEDDTGSLWHVTRTRGPAKLSVAKDNQDQTAGTTRDTQALIEAVIGLDAEAFATVVMFGQGSVKQFSAMTDKEMKGVLERLIGIEAISEAHAKARERLASAQSDLDSQSQSLQGREDAVSTTLSYMSDAKALRDRWEADRKARADRCRAALAGLGSARTGPAGRPDLRRARTALEAAQSAREGVSKRTQAARETLTEIKTKAAAADTHYQSMRARLSYWESTPVGGKCSECAQTITAEHARKEAAKARADVEAALRENEKLDQRAVAARDALKKLQQEESEAMLARDAAEKQVRAAERAEAEEEATRKSEAKERARLEKELATIEAETNDAAEQVEKLKTKLKAQKEKVEEAKAKVNEAQEEVAHVEFLVEAFSNKGLKSFLLDAVTPYLNDRAAYFAGLISRGTLTVEFQTQTTLKSGETREKFAVVARNKYGGEVYKGNSGGEKRKIDIAVSLALQALAAGRAKSQINLAFYDEPFDALDSTAGEFAMDLLSEVAKKKDTILVISHREEFRANFPTKWTARKKAGVTSIEV